MAKSASPRIEVRCSCGAKLAFPPEAAGRRAKCPKCSAILQVTAAPADLGSQSVGEKDEAALADLVVVERAAAAAPMCGNCRKPLPADSRLCIHCGFDRVSGVRHQTRTESDAEDVAPAGRWWSRIRFRGAAAEIAIFSIGIGLILLVIGVFVARNINRNAPPLPFGLPRQLTLALLVLFVAVVNIAAGTLALLYRRPVFVRLCTLAAILIALAWPAFTFAALGFPNIDVITVVGIVIAIAVVKHSSTAVAELSGK